MAFSPCRDSYQYSLVLHALVRIERKLGNIKKERGARNEIDAF